MYADFRGLIRTAIAIAAAMAEFYGRMAVKATTPETREILVFWPAKRKNTGSYWKII